MFIGGYFSPEVIENDIPNRTELREEHMVLMKAVGKEGCLADVRKRSLEVNQMFAPWRNKKFY